jgi:rubredoxin
MIEILSELPIFPPMTACLREVRRSALLRRVRLPRDTRQYMENEFKTWMCLICGWVYDEAAGAPEEGIAPGTRWADVPINWTCPECGARKEDFELVEI